MNSLQELSILTQSLHICKFYPILPICNPSACIYNGQDDKGGCDNSKNSINLPRPETTPPTKSYSWHTHATNGRL